ncbi:ComEC/Rec2 family competence protein [Maribacter sp. HTCC2170]|uniref:ComEC/Rec2 family competence protein n=1 Tax=Maribacter sp. (strain HTCC2170 / KCCM 42371) TaxID=313603 RepID=UPI00006AE61B|nr:ComEC/Rec2 family competence protein [Maribacter sp. HTCC2170]EAR00525.1 competence protein [Maribacter sp. HTCC2170]
MNLLKFVPIKLTILLVFGILIGYNFNLNFKFAFLALLISTLSLGLVFLKTKDNSRYLFGSLAVLTTILLGITISAQAKPGSYSHHYSNYAIDNQVSLVLKIQEKLKPTDFSLRYIAKVQHYEGKKAVGKLLLNCTVDPKYSSLEVDDELMVLSEIVEINSPLNPHQFNYKKYLEQKGIAHQLNLSQNNHFFLKSNTRTIKGLASEIRNKIILKLNSAGFDQDELSIIQALFLGHRDDISQTTYSNYKDAGAVHILAVSGLHIGILLLFLQFLLQPLERLPKGKSIKLMLIVIFLWGFAFLAGLSASVVRAVTMFSFVAYAMYLNRPQNTFNILALSMFFILLVFNPLLVFDVGFQMSYAAVFAIVWIYPLLQRFWYPKNWLLNKGWQLLSVSIAAQIGVVPISLYYFHQFPGLFFISNLVIVPFLGLILGLGIMVIALILLDFAPNSLIELYNLLIGVMNSVIAWVSQQETFILKNISFDFVQLLLTYALIFSLIIALTKPTFRKMAAFLTCIVLLQGWSIYTLNKTSNKEALIIGHQTKNSILSHQKGNELDVFSSDSIAAMRIVNNYQITERIDQIKHQGIENSFSYKNKKILVIDSTGVFANGIKTVDYLLLTKSPKINLDRILDSLQPKMLIADGSNYKTYIERWKRTCINKKLPFHYTGEKGAYFLD